MNIELTRVFRQRNPCALMNLPPDFHTPACAAWLRDDRGSANNMLINVISTVLMIEASMPAEARSIADSRPAIAVSITA